MVITEWKTSAQGPFVFHSDLCVQKVFIKTIKESSFEMRINVVSLPIIAGQPEGMRIIETISRVAAHRDGSRC